MLQMTAVLRRAVRALAPWAAFLPAVCANAADMRMPPPLVAPSPPPLIAEPEQPPTANRWCHVGAFTGVQHLALDHKLVSNPYFADNVNAANEHRGSAVRGLVGGFAGCNYTHNSFFGGVDIEIWTGFGPPIPTDGYALDPISDKNFLRERFSFAGSLRAGVIHGQTIFYGKVGLAYLRTDFDSDYRRTKTRETGVTPTDPWQIDVQYKSSATLAQPGLLVGLGLEYLIDKNWSTRAEVNHIFTSGEEFESTVTSGTRCDDNNASFPCNGAARQNLAGDKIKHSINLGRTSVRFGVSRRF